MKPSKKNILTTGLAVVLAAAAVLGGTFGYLQDSTENVTNTFKANQVTVSLKETTGDAYEIIPGTEQEKDPTVTVTNTVDAYVYVQVTDTTQDLVDYTIAEGWMQLDGYENIYYREVGKDDETKMFSVLEDDTVRYDAALTNENMTDKTDLKLIFQAYAIQKAPFADAAAAFAAKDSVIADDADTVKTAIAQGQPVVLAEDVELSGNLIINDNENAVIDLNGKTLTIGAMAQNGGSLTVRNGNIDTDVFQVSGENNSLILDGVTTDAYVLISEGTENSTVDITNSTITGALYAFSTNAAVSGSGQDVVVNITNSTLTALPDPNPNADAADCTGVLFNICGTLNITDSTIYGGRQAVIVRCGTANITNSTLVKTSAVKDSEIDKKKDYTVSDWEDGNRVVASVLTIGNYKEGASASYAEDAVVTLSNVTLTRQEGDTMPTVYLGSNADYSASLSCSDESVAKTDIGYSGTSCYFNSELLTGE